MDVQIKFIVCITMLFALSPPCLQAKNGLDIIDEVLSKNKSIQSIELTILMNERCKDRYIQKKADFKISYAPYKIYIKQYYPNVGLEVLFCEGKNEGKALVNRNAFPWATLKLSPLGNAMRKDNHHSIYRAGFSYFMEVIDSLFQKYNNQSTSAWKYQGKVKYANIICYKVVFDNPNFGFTSYTVKKEENLEIISNKLKVCDYMLIEYNPNLRAFDAVKPGTKIMVPVDYAKQIVFYVNSETKLPVGVKTFDEKGLFEEYTFLNVRINPLFSSLAFDDKNPDYSFH